MKEIFRSILIILEEKIVMEIIHLPHFQMQMKTKQLL